jgi:hypothetical protein
MLPVRHMGEWICISLHSKPRPQMEVSGQFHVSCMKYMHMLTIPTRSLFLFNYLGNFVTCEGKKGTQYMFDSSV